LTENAGHSPAFIYEAEGFVLKRFKRFGFFGHSPAFIYEAEGFVLK